jgi:heme-degrading monooxygenase HmoA
MLVSLTIVRYKGIFTPFGFLSMAILRVALWFYPKIKFSKLMGCGKNGTFDVNPDWHQWAFMASWENENQATAFLEKSFLANYWRKFANEKWTILCQPVESHGEWNGKNVFETSKNKKEYIGKVAVLTRATIRPLKMIDFWKNVPAVAQTIAMSPGFITSVGIGEVPFFRQATFSIWEDLESVKNFAYRKKEHTEVIKKTRQKDWYSEELFARFNVLKSFGKLNGVNPLGADLTIS